MAEWQGQSDNNRRPSVPVAPGPYPYHYLKYRVVDPGVRYREGCQSPRATSRWCQVRNRGPQTLTPVEEVPRDPGRRTPQ